MSRNNHHAGLHMISQKRYGSYDDLDYYNKIASINRENDPFYFKLKKESENSHNKTHKSNNTQIKQSTNKVQTNNQPNNLKKDKYYIESYHFDLLERVMINVLVIALKKKLDLHNIIISIEELLINNKIVNSPHEKTIAHYYFASEKSLIFFSMLAEKLECAVHELFINNDKENREYFQYLLKFYEDYWDNGYIDKNGNVYVEINCFDMLHNMTKEYYINNEFNFYIDKIIIHNEIYYRLNIGYDMMGMILFECYNFLPVGDFVWIEKEGFLKDYLENMITTKPNIFEIEE